MTRIFCHGNTPDSLIIKHVNPIIRLLDIPAPVWLKDVDFSQIGEGDILVVFGHLNHVIGWNLPEFKGYKSISSLDGKRAVYNGVTIMVSHDPSILESDYSFWTDIYWVFAQIERKLNTGSYEYQGGDCQLVKSFDADIEDIKQRHTKTGKKVPVSLDIESMGTIPHADGIRVISVSITHTSGKASVRYFHEGDTQPYIDDLRWLMSSPIVYGIGANFKFDAQWLFVKHGLECTNHEFDVVLAGSVLDEIRSNSLKSLAKLETGMGGYEDSFYDKHDIAHMEDVPVDDVVLYCGLDTQATQEVAKVLIPKLRSNQKLYNLYNKIVHPASLAYGSIERRGVVVDVERFKQLEVEFGERLEQINAEAKALMPKRLVFKHKDNFSLSRAQIVSDFLFSRAGLGIKPLVMTAKGEKPSTAKEHLEKYITVEEAAPVIKLFNEFVATQKCLGTYVTGFMRHLRPDGRFHPTYMLFRGESDDTEGGTSSGRNSCKDPAFQCQRGETQVYCIDGLHTIQSMVEGFEQGKSYEVKSHSGHWRKVVGVYRNGIRPVFEVTTRSGLVTGCTENHPLLLNSGFTRTDQVSIGDLVFVERDWHGTKNKTQSVGTEVPSSDCSRESTRSTREVGLSLRLRGRKARLLSGPKNWANKVLRLLEKGTTYYPRLREKREQQDLRVLGRHATQSKRDNGSSYGSRTLCGGSCVTRLGKIREFFGRHGGATRRGITRSYRQLWQLLQRKLSMGHANSASPQHEIKCDAYIRRSDQVYCGVGADNRSRHDFVFPDQVRVDGSRGVDKTKTKHARTPEAQEGVLEAQKAGYVLDPIVSIKYVGDEETYDLTVEVDHSFVADGIVVHNTIPKRSAMAKQLRSAYVAPPGYQIASLDYDQGELRVIACVADEKNMLRVYKENGDLHKETGMAVKKLSEERYAALTDAERSKIRDSGKSTNFGVVYDISAEGYCDFARKSYGVLMEIDEAQGNIDAFFAKFDRLRPWHDRYRKFAKEHGYTESPLGRRKNLPLLNSSIPYIRGREYRRAINNPIQGCLNDLMLYTMAIVHQQRPDIWSFGTIHDQGLFYVREETALEDALWIKNVMENLPLEKEFGWKPQLQFTAELKMGYVLSDLKKVIKG